jgi:2-oxoglutarate dehydrogenase E1 component
MNQGAWYQIQHHLLACIGDQHSLHYAGRVRSPAPAAGHLNTHIAEQARSSSKRWLRRPVSTTRQNKLTAFRSSRSWMSA